jgi:hypothetical protein
MDLADDIVSNKARLIDRWSELAIEQLALRLEASELLNALPNFLDHLVATLRDPSEYWLALEPAQSPSRHRMHSGIDRGALTEEMALVTEALCMIVKQAAEAHQGSGAQEGKDGP